MNIKQVIIEKTKLLKDNNIESASNIARILLSNLLNKSKEYLVINDKEELKGETIEKYDQCLKQIIEGYPMQYITNNQEFMRLNFYVDENVLIPQPDTEILVENTIQICKEKYTENKTIKILDLCTGSGAIAISLGKYIQNAEITAIDISKEAIKVAAKNAEMNGVKIQFVQSNMFENINEKYDIIVSNPPYIETNVLCKLPKEVQNEPRLALDGGEDGLDFYREISKKAYRYLNDRGFLVMEIGYNQKNTVIEILSKETKYKNIECIKDFGNNDRVIQAQII